MAFREGFEPPTDALEVHSVITKSLILSDFLNRKRSDKMAKIEAQSLIDKLKKAKIDYLSIIAVLEDTKLDHETREQATSIIQDTQIHTEIALEEITQ